MLGRVSRVATRASGMSAMSVRAMSTAVDIKTVGVVGAGLMGHGIAQVAADKGFQVYLCDANQEAVDKGYGMIEKSMESVVGSQVKKGKLTPEEAEARCEKTLDNITTTTELEGLAKCDLVVEAIVENVDVKRNLFSQLDGLLPRHSVLATNTSSLQLSDMIEASGRPDRFIGLHFFNPVQIMRLVEVVRTDETDPAVFEAAMQFGRDMGKEAVACKDTPGFVVNRLLVPYMAQAIAMLERGDASAADIDVAMKCGAGVPMGPLTLADYVGLDTSLFILQGWVEKYPDEPAFFVPSLLEKLVAEGRLGRKTGQGIFRWEGNKCVGE